MAAHRDRFQCETCRWGRHCDTDFSWPGSRGPAGHYRFGGISGVADSKTCFLPMISAASREWLRLHADFKAGFLPWAGGSLQQPAAWREAMQLIEATLNQIYSEDAKRGR